MKIVATSDWHLDAVTNGQRREAEIRTAVDFSVQVAIDERADLYVFGGDLCDPDAWNLLRSTSFSIEVARRLAAAGIASLWVAGNHDVVEDGAGTTTLSPLAAVARTEGNDSARLVHVVETRPTIVEVGGCELVALPFTPRSHAYEPGAWVTQWARGRRSKTMPVAVVGHLSLTGAHPGGETTEMPRGREVLWPTAELGKHCHGAVLLGGHYHAGGDVNGVQVIGSLARLNHGEEGNAPSVLVLEVIQ